ncbi:BZ3500_MvSof-1268-A1-R1_Chr11-1g03157 [Microbotryum saponariae]|uniref:pH-response regulator protein palC n=1 Tax=Microbotryum saponariae TaxID=289078 RepID=A0A2X0NCL6_9BASI|nr:BZ3501_MvSof-1269-A2-R1_Chr11g02732 [Microbotryum saponariae]SDA03717.1 BZ3500_MvSof-1268-A1-R1_Chr11-1g03157 [Microbotryum saponariae]
MLIPPPIPSSLSLPSTVQDIRGHATQLSDANSLRATMRSQLKVAHKLGVHHADWSACVKATTDYLPYLYAILGCIEADDLLLKADPVFTWRMTLSTQALKKPHHKVALPSYHYELASTLLCHALCLSNNSASLVASLGSYEFSNTLSTTDLRRHDQVVQKAAEMLCRAAGLLAHLSEVVIPRWETAVGLDSLAKSRPFELTREVTMGLAKLCEADANLLAIRRLLSRSLSVAHSTTTPGPPLSSTHPSPSLLAKLHLHVHQLYDAARSLIKAPNHSGGGGEISQALRTYLSQGRALALALSWKWLGVDCGESGGRERCGDAVGWLGMSRKELDEIQNANKGLIGVIKRGKEGAKVRKGKVGEEVESVARFLNAYKKVNDSVSSSSGIGRAISFVGPVHFMPVPSPSTLQLRVPAGRAALSAKVFTPPSPAFKSRSAYNGPMDVPPPPRALETEFGKLGIGTTGGGADSSDEDGDGEGTEGDYFGAGQYF